ncbi:hypothetical protein GCM10028803_31950 [Larkinella knui]|uniref:Peptidase M56 domain-containing protein n=1 Tax=Larkinella knui TaxID=2025310 RepID=A0A3P1CY13_9BACT|nr:M56 family metallopeptidase [Larkinella knui]RRB18215.1 hypothetical protein EHT87_08055 [Larkinella knui]
MTAFNLFSEPFTNALGWALVHTLWQGTILVAAAALALRLTQKQPASVRYGIGIGALALQLLIFMATLWICYEPVRSAVSISGDPQLTGPQTTIVRNLSLSSDWGGTLSFWLNRHLPLLVTAWLCGAVLLLVRLFGGWLFVQRLTRRNIRSAPEAWQRYLHQTARQLGITKAVRLVESAEIAVPMTIGWLKPIILLPIGLLAGLSPQQVEAVLAHELAHIRRYDYLVNLVQSAVEIVLFFHPAIWWLSARVREEREHCCDDVAIQLRGERASLAQALVHIEERRQAVSTTPALAMAFGARKQSFMQRVKRVIGVSEQQSAKPNGLLVAGCLVMLAGLVTGQHVYRPATMSQKQGNAVARIGWKKDTAIQPSIPEGRKVGSLAKLEPVLNDTIDPATRIRLEKELEHHNRQVERLELEMEKIQLPLNGLEKQLEMQDQVMRLSDKELEKVTQQLEKMQIELERNIGKATELELKKSRLNGKLNQSERLLLEQAQLNSTKYQKQMELLNDNVIARTHEKMQALVDGPLRILHDSMGVFSAKAAALAEKASFHAVELMKLEGKLFGLDSLPALPPVPEPAPIPAIAPVPALAPHPAPVPRPARAKGAYEYNGKRYTSPDEMPKPAKPPVPPAPAASGLPALAPTPPVPPTELVAPPEPAEPTKNVRMKHRKRADSFKTKAPQPAKSGSTPR